jgi:hypothetical protein
MSGSMQVKARLRRQKFTNALSPGRRNAMGNHEDLLAERLIDRHSGEEGEPSRGVRRAHLAEHVTRLGVEGRVQRQRAIAKLLEFDAVPRTPHRARAGSCGRLPLQFHPLVVCQFESGRRRGVTALRELTVATQ